MDEILHLSVLVSLQLLLDEAEVHGLLDDVEVVRNVQFLRVDWLVEYPRCVVFPQRVDQSFGGLIPAVVDLSLLRHFRNVQILLQDVGVVALEELG